jgi:hypothetical protein
MVKIPGIQLDLPYFPLEALVSALFILKEFAAEFRKAGRGEAPVLTDDLALCCGGLLSPNSLSRKLARADIEGEVTG